MKRILITSIAVSFTLNAAMAPAIDRGSLGNQLVNRKDLTEKR